MYEAVTWHTAPRTPAVYQTDPDAHMSYPGQPTHTLARSFALRGDFTAYQRLDRNTPMRGRVAAFMAVDHLCRLRAQGQPSGTLLQDLPLRVSLNKKTSVNSPRLVFNLQRILLTNCAQGQTAAEASIADDNKVIWARQLTDREHNVKDKDLHSYHSEDVSSAPRT